MKARVALLLLGLASVARATPAERFGFGSRAGALSAAVAADALDHSAVYYDPAALTLGEGSTVGLGYQAGDYALTLDGEPSAPDSVHVLEGGLIARGSLLSMPVALGIAFALPDGALSDLRTLREDRPAWLVDELSNHVAFAGVGAALRPLPWLSLGGSVGYLAAVRGGFTVTGTAVQPVGGRSELESELRHAVDAELVSVRYPTFGALIEPSERVRVALVYREQALIEQRISGELTGGVDYGGLRIPIQYVFASESVAAYLPRQLTLAASVLSDPATRWDASLAFQNLAQMPSPEARTGSRVQAEPPPGLVFELPVDRDAPARKTAGFADRLVPRLGVERLLTIRSGWRLALRLGIGYEAETREATSAWLDASRLLLSGGSGLSWRASEAGEAQLDVHLSYAHFVERTLRVLGDDREHTVGGNALGTGLGLRLNFY